MKKFLLGLVLGVALFPGICDVIELVAYKFPENETVNAVLTKTYIPRYGFYKVFNGSCTKDVSKNGHGWTFVRREYFQCGTISIAISDLIFGEYQK